VNAAIVQHEFSSPEGSTHLAAAGIQPVHHTAVVPQQGCVPLALLPPGWVVTRHTQPGPAEVASGSSSQQQQWGRPSQQRASSPDADAEQCWPGPEAVMEQLPLQSFEGVLQHLQHASLLAQPRLLDAFRLYQALFARVSDLQLVDVQMGELQRPMQLGAFLALQRLHLENMCELLQTEWAMKVRELRGHCDATLSVRPVCTLHKHLPLDDTLAAAAAVPH
jgi:hypothetical protein